jgi:single-strand DNA-binding protein
MFGIETAFTGRLGRDPDLKMVKGGTMAMVTLAVAVDEAPPKEGQEAKSTWVNTKLFGDKAQAAADTLVKGDRVYCEGRLSLDEWTAGDGTQRHGLSCLANVAQPLGKIGQRRPRQTSGDQTDGTRRSNGASASQYRRAAAAQAPIGGRGRNDADPMENDGLPF